MFQIDDDPLVPQFTNPQSRRIQEAKYDPFGGSKFEQESSKALDFIKQMNEKGKQFNLQNSIKTDMSLYRSKPIETKL